MRLIMLAGSLLVLPIVLLLTSDAITLDLTAGLELMFGAAILTFVAERRLDRQSAFSPCVTAGVLYPLHFALPFISVPILGEHAFVLARPDQLAGSVWIVAIGLLLHTLGYLLVRAVWVGRSGGPGKGTIGQVSTRALARFSVVLLVLDVAGKMARVLGGAYFQTQIATQGDIPPELWPIVMMMSSFGFAAFAVTYSGYLLHPDTRGSWGKAAAGIWAYNFLFHLPTGRKESLLFLLVLPVLVRGVLGQSLGKRWRLTAVAAGAVAVFTFTTIYRAGMQAPNSEAMGVDATTISEMYERGRASRGGDEGLGGYLADGLTAMVSRLSLIDSVYATLELNPPDRTLDGETLLWLPMSIAIPRALWPDKPAMHLGNDFGRRFGFIASDDSFTSVSVSYIGEFIWNFGAWGVLAMFGLGALNALLYSIVLVRRSPERIAFYALIWLPLAYLGGEFAMYYAGILKTLAILGAIWWVVRRTAVSTETGLGTQAHAA